MKFENKTIFITGGLSGIGKACALAVAKEGANIAIADISGDSNNAEMEEIVKLNPEAIFIACDVSDYNQVENAISKTVNKFGKLDIALNNAGIGGEANIVGEMSETSWLKVIGVNLTGVFNCMKHELAQMSLQNSGVIINIASILGKVGFANSAHYVAAKHGVIGLTKSAAIEYATKGIRINAICPGFINTPLLTKGGISENTEVKQSIVNLHPMKRFGTGDEIAKGFLFLASDGASFITGTSLDIDGGYLAQ